MNKRELEEKVMEKLYNSYRCYQVEDWKLMYFTGMEALLYHSLLESNYVSTHSFDFYYNKHKDIYGVSFDTWYNKFKELYDKAMRGF